MTKKHDKNCDSNLKDRLCNCYAIRTKEQWIRWAEKEIKEYQEFIKFLKGK